MICLDEMGPVAPKSYAGQATVRSAPQDGAGRAAQELDDGRRGTGDVFGAFAPATGEALTVADDGRTTATWVDCLARVAGWVDPAAARVDAVLDNLSTHRALDVPLFAVAHPRWAFVCQPTDAADLNPIEPWGNTRRSLARTGRRVEPWEEVAGAAAAATADRNRQRHPVGWGRRRRPRARRREGIGHMPVAA